MATCRCLIHRKSKINYSNLYVNLLVKHGTEERPTDGYYERHHIVPVSLGGKDNADNLIYLSGRVHFIAHWLLFKIHRNQEMARAFYGMCDTYRRPERRKPTSRAYESAKSAFSIHNHMRDSKHRTRASRNAKAQWGNDETRETILKNLMPMFSDENHPMYMKGKVGDAHPRSRAVVTPLGRFGSVRQAAKVHGVAHPLISRYCKSEEHPQYFYEDKL